MAEGYSSTDARNYTGMKTELRRGDDLSEVTQQDEKESDPEARSLDLEATVASTLLAQRRKLRTEVKMTSKPRIQESWLPQEAWLGLGLRDSVLSC